MEDAPTLLKIPMSQCPDIWIRLPKHKWPKSWSNMEDPVVPLERNLYGHPLAGLSWEKQYEKVLFWNTFGKRFQIGNVYSWQETEHQSDLEILMKDVDLWEPTSFLDHVYLGCTQRKCTISNDTVTRYRDMFEAKISAGKQKLSTEVSGKLDAETISSWSYDIESHAKKCAERYCELANKTTHSYTKSQRHAWITINSKMSKMRLWENCLQSAHKLFSNVCIWLVLGDLTHHGVWINLLVRWRNGQKHVTRRLARLISYIHHTCEFR